MKVGANIINLIFVVLALINHSSGRKFPGWQQSAQTKESSSVSSPLEVQDSSKVGKAEGILLEFLASEGHDPTKQFHVQGWRWHTMSVIRESKRLEKLARRLDPSEDEHVAVLNDAVNYVMDFNLGALRRVEKMFFGWIRQNTKSKTDNTKVVKALNTVLDQLDLESSQITRLSLALTSDTSDEATRVSRVAETSKAIAGMTEAMLQRELKYVIPTVAQLIPEAAQNKFNNKVISTLGVFDARLHLVHMHEVVTEQKSAKEEQLWKEAIPSLPRSLIPRWKRTLYEPKAGCLNF